MPTTRPRTASIRWTVCLTALLIAAGTGAQGRAEERLQARLDGRAIPLKDVAGYYCHDRGYPVIECFTSAGDRDTDSTSASYGVLSAPFVVFYQDEDYRGLNYEAWNAIPNLGTIGWNDMVTSFKSLNLGRPRWFKDAGYGYPSWRWAAGAWVPNVGDAANDAFSSVKNDP